VLGLHHGAPPLCLPDHVFVADAQFICLALGVGPDLGGSRGGLGVDLGGLVLGRPQHPRYALTHALDRGGRCSEPLQLGVQVIDLPASRLQCPGELRSLRSPGIAIRHCNPQIGP
jgi:hypothetical protein